MKKEKRKLTEEQKYILRAAKLKGLAAVEINALKKHFTGEAPNDYIIRRNPDLFELLEKRKEEKQGVVESEDGTVVKLDNVIVSKTAEEEPGIARIVTPSLTTYISKPTTGMDESSKFHSLSRKNELFLPFVAKNMGVDAAVFFEVEIENETGNTYPRHITKNLIKEDEEFISGKQILNKDKDKEKQNKKKSSKKISMNSLLDKTDKFIKKFGKKEEIKEEDLNAMRENIRKGLIKQTFINKLILNDNESNENWGLIRKDKTLKLAPMFGFEQAAGVIKHGTLPMRRVVGKTGRFMGREDIQSFMLVFGKEKWFKEWVTEALNKFSIEEVFENAETTSNVTLTEQEKEYYKAVMNKTLSLAREVVDVDFDESKLSRLSLFKSSPKKLKKQIDRDDSITF